MRGNVTILLTYLAHQERLITWMIPSCSLLESTRGKPNMGLADYEEGLET